MEPDAATPTCERRSMLDAIRNGDRGAETEFIRSYKSGLTAMLRRRLDRVLAEDVVQDTFAEALRILRTRALEEPDKLSGFLHAIALNLLRNDARKRARQRTESDMDAVDAAADGSDDPAAAHARASLASAVHRLLDALPQERDRQVLRLYYLHDHDKISICAQLGLDADHFDRVIYRARQRVREIIADGRSGLKLSDFWLLLLFFGLASTAMLIGIAASERSTRTGGCWVCA